MVWWSLEKIVVDDDSEKFFQVKAQLPPWEKEELIVFLKRNIDVFAYSTYKALGVDSNFIYHHLNVNPFIIPKKQPPWHSSKDNSDAVKDKVTKFKQVRAIKLPWVASQYCSGEKEEWKVAGMYGLHRFE